MRGEPLPDTLAGSDRHGAIYQARRNRARAPVGVALVEDDGARARFERVIQASPQPRLLHSVGWARDMLVWLETTRPMCCWWIWPAGWLGIDA